MPVTSDQMLQWCQTLIAGREAAPDLALTDYLAAIPKLDSLSDVPAGTPVLVRGDVDAKPGDAVGQGDIRLRSMQETLAFGCERGWKQVIFRSHRSQAGGVARQGCAADRRIAVDRCAH